MNKKEKSKVKEKNRKIKETKKITEEALLFVVTVCLLSMTLV